jgi:two-component system chemotaxis response regulator CheB
MPARDIIVVGASAGGVETLMRLFKPLQPDLPAAFFVVMHVSAQTRSLLPDLLTRAGHIPARHAIDQEQIEHGRIYVAPPDYHLLIEDGRIRLSHGPKENRHRPAIDPLFRTAAEQHGGKAIGIILSGTMDDGSTGLKEIKRHGGLAMVQDPDEALYPDMPRNACAVTRPDFCLPVAEIGSTLPTLIRKPVKEGVMRNGSKDRGMKPEDKRIKTAKEVGRELGSPSGFVCPECNGPLWAMQDGKVLHYRCLVGHAYAPQNLFAAQTAEVERALWIALRTLEERVELQRQLSERAKKHKRSFATRQFLSKSQENARHARIIRRVLEKL